MRIKIPLSCPECNGRMYAVCYEPAIRLLEHRSWQYCRECGFVRDIKDFKKQMLCA